MVAADFAAALEGLVVLIADGNSYSRRLTRMMLMNAGVRVNHEATGGAAALEAIREINPDVMILEWSLPVMDGPTVMRAVRSPDNFPKPNLPIIMLSDSGESSRIYTALRLGVHEFLIKPISSKALQQRLLGIVLKPRPMVLADGCYIPRPRRKIECTEPPGAPGEKSTAVVDSAA
jgi:CheY-like chemotaxis protein